MASTSTSQWYVAYQLREDDLTGHIVGIWGSDDPAPPEVDSHTWVKVYPDATDALGAYMRFTKWFEENHPFYELKYERS